MPSTTNLRHRLLLSENKSNGCKRMSTDGRMICSWLSKTVNMNNSKNLTSSRRRPRSNSKLFKTSSRPLMPNSRSKNPRRKPEMLMKKSRDNLMNSTEDQVRENKHSTPSSKNLLKPRTISMVTRTKSKDLRLSKTEMLHKKES